VKKIYFPQNTIFFIWKLELLIKDGFDESSPCRRETKSLNYRFDPSFFENAIDIFFGAWNF
jgi:hypothetical protein